MPGDPVSAGGAGAGGWADDLRELRYPDGGSKVVTDPANPRQVGGAFGPKSVVEFPGYAPPDWLTAPAEPVESRDGSTAVLEVPGPDDVIAARIWAPAGARADEALPLLVAHDGPEYDTLASLTRYLAAGVAGVTPRLDSQERRFPYFRRITGFTAEMHDGGLPPTPIPVALTCGTIEENAANNRLMAQTLTAHGYRAELSEVPDGHNYTAWRDASDPYLTRLLQRVRP